MSINRVGILGGGQLARMLALSAHPLGISCVALEPSDNPCAQDTCTVLKGAYDDLAAVEALCAQCNVLTFENENIPAITLKWLDDNKINYAPSAKALHTSQDRLIEKQFFNALDIATANFYAPENLQDIIDSWQRCDQKALLKTRRDGYDGKGQYRLNSIEDCQQAFHATQHTNVIIESLVPFDAEYSMLATRASNGVIVYYPLTQNIHHHGILKRSIAPINNSELFASAKHIMQQVLNALSYVGTLAIEFFCVDQKLLANEMAPRVHNSGHWTQNASVCSQFENHIRAICNLPLGDTAALGYCEMHNCLGSMPPAENILNLPSAHLHDYNKAPRPGRKLGHINFYHPDSGQVKKDINLINDC